MLLLILSGSSTFETTESVCPGIRGLLAVTTTRDTSDGNKLLKQKLASPSSGFDFSAIIRVMIRVVNASSTKFSKAVPSFFSCIGGLFSKKRSADFICSFRSFSSLHFGTKLEKAMQTKHSGEIRGCLISWPSTLCNTPIKFDISLSPRVVTSNSWFSDDSNS